MPKLYWFGWIGEEETDFPGYYAEIALIDGSHEYVQII